MKTLNKKIINDFLFMLIFFFISNRSIGQNCNFDCTELIQNRNLAITPPGWPIQYGESGYSFNIGYVLAWKASHGSPHHCQLDNQNQWNCSFTTPNGTETNGISI